MNENWMCDSPQCRAQFEPSKKMKSLKAENGARKFFCEPCRKNMIDGRIGKRMGWVRKDSVVRK